MSKYLDSDGLLYLWSKIKSLAGGKVDKVEGMGLTANNYTDGEKEKLANLYNYTLPEAGPQTLGGVKVGAGLAVEAGVLSAHVGWESLLDKPDVALKSDITAMYRYKGSKASFAALPLEGNETGDVWNVEETGMNYAWTGSQWDALGQAIEIQSITNAEIDALAL